MKKIILITALILFLIGAGIAVYEYNKPHKKISNEKTNFSLNASELYNDYQKDEGKANSKYLNKVVEVKGKVTEKYKDQREHTVLLMKSPDDFFGVSCTFNKENSPPTDKIKQGDNVSIKGVCTGGGEMMDVILVNCIMENE